MSLITAALSTGWDISTCKLPGNVMLMLAVGCSFLSHLQCIEAHTIPALHVPKAMHLPLGNWQYLLSRV
jgi:hypothetical protein